jgi:hypothetical protein
VVANNIVEQTEARASDADIICNLILLEHLIGEKMESRTLAEYVEPYQLLRLINLIPWQFERPSS